MGLARQAHACTHTTLAPTIMHAGTKTNVIPDRVELQIDIRTLPGWDETDVRAMLTELMGRPYPAASLACDTLDAVALNRPIIVAPRRATMVWAAYRAWPGLIINQGPRRLRAPSGGHGGSPPQRSRPGRR